MLWVRLLEEPYPRGTRVFGNSVPGITGGYYSICGVRSTLGYPDTWRVSTQRNPAVLGYLEVLYPAVLDDTRVFGDFVPDIIR